MAVESVERKPHIDSNHQSVYSGFSVANGISFSPISARLHLAAKPLKP